MRRGDAMEPLRDTIRTGSHRRRQLPGAAAIRQTRTIDRGQDSNSFEVSPVDSADRDKSLLAALQRNEMDAFESLVQLHRDSVLDLSRRILKDDSLAEDVV